MGAIYSAAESVRNTVLISENLMLWMDLRTWARMSCLVHENASPVVAYGSVTWYSTLDGRRLTLTICLQENSTSLFALVCAFLDSRGWLILAWLQQIMQSADR